VALRDKTSGHVSGATVKGPGELTSATGQYLASRGDGHGGLETQEGRERMLLVFLLGLPFGLVW
jgi:hypothetical protein